MSKVCFKLIVLTRVRRRLANVFLFTNKSTDEIWFFRENEAHPRTRADTSEAKWFATSAGPVKRAPPDAQQTGKKPWDCVQVSLAFDDLVTIHLSTGGLWYLTDLMTFMSDFSRWYWCIFSGKADSVGGPQFYICRRWLSMADHVQWFMAHARVVVLLHVVEWVSEEKGSASRFISMNRSTSCGYRWRSSMTNKSGGFHFVSSRPVFWLCPFRCRPLLRSAAGRVPNRRGHKTHS